VHKEVHDRDLFFCPIDDCDKSFLKKQSLQIHLQHSHPIEMLHTQSQININSNSNREVDASTNSNAASSNSSECEDSNESDSDNFLERPAKFRKTDHLDVMI